MECFPCESGGRGRCDRLGAAYSITCEEEQCAEKGVRYDGECFRPAYTRGRDHLRGFKNKSEENVLWKHSVNDHQGSSNVNFVMKVLKTYGRDNLTRQVNEAMRINNNSGIKLNSKAEYRQPSVPRLVLHGNVNE